jgi:hypothetical protein
MDKKEKVFFKTKGNWLTVMNETTKEYVDVCQRCKTILPAKVGTLIRCKCDDENLLILPSCKKEYSGNCHGCATGCCQEGK